MAIVKTQDTAAKERNSTGQSSIIHVAKLAKVSPATVARTFAGNYPVATKTRDRILVAAKELGYRPNLLARGLRGGRTQTIGLLWGLSALQTSVEMAKGIALRILRRGYVTYLADNLGDHRVIGHALEDFVRRGVDGIILHYPVAEAEKEGFESLLKKFPAAVIVTFHEEPLHIDQLVHDRTESWRAVAEHFRKTGRQRPAMLTNVSTTQEKAQAFTDQWHRECPNEGPILIDTASSRPEGFYRTLDQRFAAGPLPFDALMCGTDEGAFVAMQWLKKWGARVPEDVAVVGFNNSEIGRFTDPPLASVERRDGEVAEALERMLFGRLEHPDLPVQRAHIPMSFVWRESAG